MANKVSYYIGDGIDEKVCKEEAQAKYNRTQEFSDLHYHGYLLSCNDKCGVWPVVIVGDRYQLLERISKTD